MSESTIGIKVADGSYVPIMTEEFGKRKRLVLTTVNDNQPSVQVDIYRGSGETLENAVYIGSLQIENIDELPKGQPELELLVGLDDEGNLDATVSDNATGESQSLSVSLASLESGETYDVPDFSIDENEFEAITPEEEEGLSFNEMTMVGEEEKLPPKKKKNPLLVAAFVVFGLVIIVLVGYLLLQLFQGRPEDSTPPLEADNQKPFNLVLGDPDPDPDGELILNNAEDGSDSNVSRMEPAGSVEAGEEASDQNAGTVNNPEPSSEPDKEQQQVMEPADEEPVQTVTVIKTVSAGGVWYRIRRGDTLSELAFSFYDDIYKYPVIADENNIENPDLIITGDKIFIPEQ